MKLIAKKIERLISKEFIWLSNINDDFIDLTKSLFMSWQ